jgi:hypothetical protein
MSPEMDWRGKRGKVLATATINSGTIVGANADFVGFPKWQCSTLIEFYCNIGVQPAWTFSLL